MAVRPLGHLTDAVHPVRHDRGLVRVSTEQNQGTCQRSAHNVWFVWRLTISCALARELAAMTLPEALSGRNFSPY
jgi:hypothetical protein